MSGGEDCCFWAEESGVFPRCADFPVPPPPGREMVGKSLIAGLVVLLVAAVSLFLGVFMGLGKKNTPPTSDHFYSKAAVAADAGKCSEVGR